jgi:hypothetical protein
MSVKSSKPRLFLCCLLGVSAMLLPWSELHAEEDSVLQLLKGYEWQIDENLAAALPLSAVAELLTIAGTEGQQAFIRSRALEVLAWLASDRLPGNQVALDQIWNFLQGELALSSGVDRRRLMETLALGFNRTRPDQLVEILAPCLVSEDTHLRLIAARWLTRVGNPAALRLVADYRNRVAASGNSWERDALGILPGS